VHSPAGEHPHGGRPQEHSALPHATVADEEDAAGSKAEPCVFRKGRLMPRGTVRPRFMCLATVFTEKECHWGLGLRWDSAALQRSLR
jgi:hypothetical protein